MEIFVIFLKKKTTEIIFQITPTFSIVKFFKQILKGLMFFFYGAMFNGWLLQRTENEIKDKKKSFFKKDTNQFIRSLN